ncbi:hypothetical protein BDZ94DRAFT_1182777 [Collybia nuda]|uniref:Uncharacterized protein n=1 Tax=Collybia nuda TaxID=64659 RepID=A0A9P6CP66_9AGAR|nr:hypothetical protein BDZ94DRAFT_1182777 [Collybia nuda]
MYFDSVEKPAKPRLPDPHYKGRNGYEESNPTDLKEIPDNVPPTVEQLIRHRLAQYVLTQKDRPIPTLEEMARDKGTSPSLPNLKEQITKAQKQHLTDLERLYTLHAEEYLDDAKERYMAVDDLLLDPENGLDDAAAETYSKVDELFNDPRKYPSILSVWEDSISHMRHAHLRHLQYLREEYRKAEQLAEAQIAKEEAERKAQEALFPSSIEDFYMKPKDVQHRAARFLLLTDSSKQEKTLSEFGWAWRQVKPLQDEMKVNASKLSLYVYSFLYKPIARIHGRDSGPCY